MLLSCLFCILHEELMLLCDLVRTLNTECTVLLEEMKKVFSFNSTYYQDRPVSCCESVSIAGYVRCADTVRKHSWQCLFCVLLVHAYALITIPTNTKGIMLYIAFQQN